MALYRGGPSDKMTNLVYQTGKLISGGPTTPLARKQELRQLMQAEELNLENFARYNELYSEFKDRIPDS